MSEDDEDIYGDDPTPIIPTSINPEPAQVEEDEIANPKNNETQTTSNEIEEKEIPKYCFSVKKLDWWITDEQIMTKLRSIANVIDLKMKYNPKNGKFEGKFVCILESEKSKNDLINSLRKLKFNEEE